MPSNHTEHYELSQWEKTDQVLMEDFNADNAKIDEALSGLAQTAAAHAAEISKLGNCQIEMFTYEGNGGFGENSPTRINFPKLPLLFAIFGENAHGFGSRMVPAIWAGNEGAAGALYGSWNGNQFSFYSSRADIQLNRSGFTYYIAAFYD